MSKLNILWVNDDPNIAHSMVFMYAINSIQNDWWKEVDVILWGPVVKLVAENTGVQEKIKLAQFTGVNVVACISCATQYGVVEELRELGLEVKAMGEPLTELLKNDEKLLTV